MSHFNLRLPIALVVGLLAASLFLRGTEAPTMAPNWPQWRGPDGQGISPERDLPTQWSPTRNILWKTPIPGHGYSSPIVWGKRVFLTAAIEGPVVPGAKAVRHLDKDGKGFAHPDAVGADHLQTFVVLCLDSETGKILWERIAFKGTPHDDHHRLNTYATPTPVTDGRYVYAYFGAEGLYCYDFQGNRIWKTSLGPIATMGMGVASSPVLYEELLIIVADQDNGVNSFLAAVDKKTGREVWRVSRTALESWSSPILVRTPQRAELVVSARELVISYDPATGKELWRCSGPGHHPTATPVARHGLVVITAGRGEKRVFAVRLGGSGDLTGTPYVAWRYDRGTAHVASPILYGDHLYLITDGGMMTWLDAKTGHVRYRGARLPVPTKFSASIVAFDGKILLSSEDGDNFLLEAGPRHKILHTNPIGEPIFSSPAIAGGKILIRSEKTLFCISKKRVATGQRSSPAANRK